MSPRSNRKPAFGQQSTLIKHVTLMSYKLEPVIWSCDTGQRITWFNRCQLILTWCHTLYIKKVHSKPRLLCQPIIWSMAAILRDSTTGAAVVVRTRPRAIPLAVIIMEKSTHGFPFLYTRGKRLRMRKASIFKMAVVNANFTTRTPFFELKSNFTSIQNFKTGNVKPPGMHWSKDF